MNAGADSPTTQKVSDPLVVRTDTDGAVVLEEPTSVTSSSYIPDLRAFAEGLQRGYSALKVALIYPYSTGPVEGQINRL